MWGTIIRIQKPKASACEKYAHVSGCHDGNAEPDATRLLTLGKSEKKTSDAEEKVESRQPPNKKGHAYMHTYIYIFFMHTYL